MNSDAPHPPSDQTEETIRLDQFLKLAGISETGGQAKLLIQAGFVEVNGVTETRRRKQLRPGDVVCVEGEDYVVISDADDD